MKIIHWGRAKSFIKEHPQAERPLALWKRAVVEAKWSNFPQIKSTFNSVDWYEGAIIFDISGNNIRLIAFCRFEMSRLYIQKVMTHEEYDKGLWKNQIKKTAAFGFRQE